MTSRCEQTAAQKLAIQVVGRYLVDRLAPAREQLADVLAMSNLGALDATQLIPKLQAGARVAVHFHPDRVVGPGEQTVGESLVVDGRLKNQFESRISNGGLAPFLGGPRDQWEQAMFSRAYQGIALGERPKYGAVALIGHGDGPAPRFGSCYLLLHQHVGERCTLTYGDSYRMPATRGTWGQWEDILAGMFGDAFEKDAALGLRGIRPPALLHALFEQLQAPTRRGLGRSLDHYVEAQIHSKVELESDVEAVVADPSFRGTPVQETLEAMCQRYHLRLAWHPGFTLAVADVPDNFRGPTMPAVAREVAVGGKISAYTIGLAAAAARLKTAALPGNDSSAAAQLKWLWHTLVRFGEPLAG